MSRASYFQLFQIALCGAIAVAPLRAEASPARSGSTLRTSCNQRSGEELFVGLFFGTGESADLAEKISSKESLEAAKNRRSRLTVSQTKRMLERQQKTLADEGRTEDAKVIGNIVAQLGTRNGSARLDSELPPPSAEQRQRAAAAVVKLIQAHDRTFLSRFAADLQSGDPVRVDRAVREGMRLNMQMLGTVTGRGKPTADDGDSGHGVDQDSSVVLWLGLVVIVLVWVAIPLTTESLTALAHDESVARLTRALRC